MNKIDTLDPQSLETRAFRSRFDDGIGDLLVGLVVLVMGASVGTDYGGLMGIWAALVYPLWLPIHRAVSVPRVGYVEFGPGRQAKMRKRKVGLALGLGLSMFAGIALFVWLSGQSPESAEAFRPHAGWPFLGALAAMLAVGGTLLDLRRGYAYAAALLASGALAPLAPGIDPLAVSLLASGAGITVCGIVLLARFLRDNPRRDAHGPS